MRLRQRDLKTVYIKQYKPMQETDGTTYNDYGEPKKIKAKIQPAGGRVMAEIYGSRLGYMLTMFFDGPIAFTENDGVCVYVPPTQKPDYKIASIRPWYGHVVADLEKVM